MIYEFDFTGVRQSTNKTGNAIDDQAKTLFARAEGLPFDHGECPHAGRAQRNLFRSVVWQLEEAQPGTRQALLRTHERLVERWLADGGTGAPGRCRACGEPASGELCRACTFLLRGAPTRSEGITA